MIDQIDQICSSIVVTRQAKYIKGVLKNVDKCCRAKNRILENILYFRLNHIFYSGILTPNSEPGTPITLFKDTFTVNMMDNKTLTTFDQNNFNINESIFQEIKC